MGVVNWLHVNSKTKRYWIIDWRVCALEIDDKTTLVLMQEMFDDAIKTKKLPFRVVLMDSWYATKDLMLHIHRTGEFFYCSLKSNCKVDDSGGIERYKAVKSLQWSAIDDETGKLIKINGVPGTMKDKIFRVAKDKNCTEWVITNDLDQSSIGETRKILAVRWKIEKYYREVKQTLRLE